MLNESKQCFRFFNDKQRSWKESQNKCKKENLVTATPSEEVVTRLPKYLFEKYGMYSLFLQFIMIYIRLFVITSLLCKMHYRKKSESIKLILLQYVYIYWSLVPAKNIWLALWYIQNIVDGGHIWYIRKTYQLNWILVNEGSSTSIVNKIL